MIRRLFLRRTRLEAPADEASATGDEGEPDATEGEGLADPDTAGEGSGQADPEEVAGPGIGSAGDGGTGDDGREA
jgi:hypothetical protein